MENSENNDNAKKIAIIILIILLLLGIIFMIKLVKKDDSTDNNTLNTTNSTSSISNTATNNTTNTTDEVEEEIEEESDDDSLVEENQTQNTIYTSNTSKVIYSKNKTNSTSSTPSSTTGTSNTDTSSPVLDVKYSNESITNQDVIVTINANETLQSIYGWTLSSDGLTLSKTYSENTSEEIYVKDLSGNITTVNVNITNIDKSSPNIETSYSTTDYTNKNVTVTIKSNEELQTVSGWSLSSDKLTLTKTYTENTVEQISVKDLAGNTVNVDISMKNIDTEEPTIIVADTLFTTKEISTTLTLQDDLSGIDLSNSYYMIDTSEEADEDILNYNEITSEEMEIDKTVSEDGTYYLHVIATDNVGNTVTKIVKLTVDTVEPVVSVKYSTTKYTNGDVTVTVTANKEMQSLSGWILSDDGLTFTKTYTSNTEETVTFTDLVGRTVSATIVISNIDKVSPLEPVLSQTIFNSKPIDNSTKIDINLKATIADNDDGSGLDLSNCKYILSTSNTKITDFSSANTFTSTSQTLYFSIEENSTYYLHIQLTDNVGNTTYTVHTIISDTLNPIVTREYSTKDITNENVTVTVKSNEVLQGKEGWEVYDGGLILRKEYTENTSKTIETFYDLAGNSVAVDITITNIDKTAPYDATVSNTAFNEKTFNITIGLSDNYSGIDIDSCKYVLDTNNTSDYASATILTSTTQTLTFNVNTDGIYYLHILSVDNAGNETDTVKEIKVDTTSPEATVTYSTTSITNEDVTVTITANEELQALSGWTLSSDKLTLTKTFTANTDVDVTISDLLGNTTTLNILIENIDKTTPSATVSYSTTSQTEESVVVTITANEKIVSVDGWTISSDGLTLTKTFAENDTETVTIRDLAGNYTTVSVIVANII